MERSLTLFWFWLSFMLSLVNGGVREVTQHDEPVVTAMPTLQPADYFNITISPAIKVNYTLKLSSSGPAVLDSVMRFTAELLVKPDNKPAKGRFHFLWLNTADYSQDSCEARHHAVLNKSFQGDVVDPGNFVMMVIVSPVNNSREILAFSSTLFILTEHLNGHLKVKQKLAYQRNNVTYASDQPIKFQVDITDYFKTTESPQYTFYWYNGSKLIHETENPNFEKNFSHPSVLHLQAVANAEFPTPPTFGPPPGISDKIGSFKEKITFKESLSGCNLTRVDSDTEDQSLKLGRSLVLNITCGGSSPSAVCWNVTQLNVNETLNQTCKPPSKDFPNTTHHQVTVSISQGGWSTVHIAVYNDVSLYKLSQNYYVYDPDTVNIPALVIPTVFIVLGVVIAAVGGTYIVRLRRKKHVEVADFDFAPAISVRSSTLSSVVTAVKHFFSKSRRPMQYRVAEQSRFEDARGFYDSL